MKRATWSTNLMGIIGALVTALVLVWMVAHLVPATVHSAVGLRDVAFGWPLAWYHQDLSRYEPASYPASFTIAGDRVDPLPTIIDVFPLLGSVLITAIILWLVIASLIVLFRPSIMRALASKRDAATELG